MRRESGNPASCCCVHTLLQTAGGWKTRRWQVEEMFIDVEVPRGAHSDVRCRSQIHVSEIPFVEAPLVHPLGHWDQFGSRSWGGDGGDRVRKCGLLYAMTVNGVSQERWVRSGRTRFWSSLGLLGFCWISGELLFIFPHQHNVISCHNKNASC